MAEDDDKNPEQNSDAGAQEGQRQKRAYTRKPPAADAAPPAEPYTETVTYVPREGDNPSTKWGGHTFHANVPKELPCHAEGTPAQRANHALVEAARTNKFFKVGEFDAKKDGVPATEQTPVPKTSEQYRAHVVGWLSKMSSEHELDAKWMAEEPLRNACGVGTDDLDWLGSLIAPKRAELHKAGMAA